MPKPPNFNPNFSQPTNQKLASLFKYEPPVDYITDVRKRPSTLDPHLPEILERYYKNWSYERITQHLKKYPKFSKLNKSTVMRRIHKFQSEE